MRMVLILGLMLFALPLHAAEKACVIGGCSSQLCFEEGEISASTCEWSPSYACYKQTSTCERQQGGKCGWTLTTELKTCLANNGQNAVLQEPMENNNGNNH